jgi:hypothetical protein
MNRFCREDLDMTTSAETKEQLGGKTMQGDRGDAKAQPSGPRGDNPATAGQGETQVKSKTSENAEEKINPSAPGETGTTPGTNGKAIAAKE